MPTWSAPPDFGDLARHLAVVEGEISQSEQRIAELQKLVAELREGGHDTADGESLLGEAERALHAQLDRRDAILRLIDSRPSGAS